MTEGADFGKFVDKLLEKETWGQEWPPLNLFAVSAHMTARAGIGRVQVSIIGKGQFTTVLKVMTPHYSVAVKIINETCTEQDIDFVAHEFTTEARVLWLIEQSSSEAKRHIGQFYHSALLQPRAPILVLDAYDNYSELSQLIDAKFHHDYNFDWLMCVRQVLFHIVITLAQLQRDYPQFRHNDLKDNNVLFCLLAPDEQVTIDYMYEGIRYELDPILIDTKIVDFATCHSAHPDIQNQQVLSLSYDSYDITAAPCPMYDLHFFILCFMLRTRRVADSGCVRIVLQFFDDIIPAKYFEPKYINSMSRLTLQGQKDMTEDVGMLYQTPAQVLLHPFFAPLVAMSASKTVPEKTVDPAESMMHVDTVISEMLNGML